MSDNDFEGFDPYEGLTDLTGGEPLPSLEPGHVPPAAPPRSPLLTGLIVALLLVVVTVALFQLLGDDGEGAAAGSTTTTGSPDTSGSGGETTTTEATSTTGGDTTTTTGAPGAVTPYEPRGEPLTLDNLTLAADAIGPIELGQAAERAVGRLVASLGDPDEDTGPIVSTGAYGTCEGSMVRIVRWGALAAVVVIDDNGDEIFAGYRVDLAYEDAFSSETADLETLSGLRPGNSIRRIEEVYSEFDRRFVVDPEVGDAFELYGTSGSLLLWGPITQPDTGVVRGIFSPDACDRFQ
ncbi:MAG TPA: hypothetical protein VGC47_06650 [Acidimicrobiia bacterium]|jgi:hypothetical protein